MSRPKSARVFLKLDGVTVEFMWANLGPDESVMLGFPWPGKQMVELVLDDVGELRPPRIVAKEEIGEPKISFHPSGKFKLTARMGKTGDSIDRVTVDGPRLEEISEPRRMLELLLPAKLPQTDRGPTEHDIILDTSSSPKQPLRCTISCVSNENVRGVLTSGRPFVDTSIWESSAALQNQTHSWVWTVRASRNDEVYLERIAIFIFGAPKWGSPKNDPGNPSVKPHAS
jgi:hypothetical protein